MIDKILVLLHNPYVIGLMAFAVVGVAITIYVIRRIIISQKRDERLAELRSDIKNLIDPQGVSRTYELLRRVEHNTTEHYGLTLKEGGYNGSFEELKALAMKHNAVYIRRIFWEFNPGAKPK